MDILVSRASEAPTGAGGVEEPRGCAVPVVSMSKKEFDRLEVLLGVQSGRLRVADACALLSLKRRQVFRLLAGLKHSGAASLVSQTRQGGCAERRSASCVGGPIDRVSDAAPPHFAARHF